MPLVSELNYTTLTRAVNQIKSPNQFLQRLLYGNHVTLPTETVQIETISKGREIAPFVRKNGEGIMVGGGQASAYAVNAPNIRIKRPFSPSELLFKRQPGSTVIFNPTGATVASQVQQHIARDLQYMADMIVNAQEYLVSGALQNVVSYEVADEEVFQITYQRPSANNIDLDTHWDENNPTPLQDIVDVKRVVADDGSPAVTDAICGSEASATILALAEAGSIPALSTDSGVTAGDLSFVNQFSDDGVLYLGRLGGVRFWEYARTATLSNGTTHNMIRPKYIEFASRSAASRRVMYYGAIPDMAAFQGRNFQAERFSKAWEQEDPSAVMNLTHSRPLPVPERPGATVSMKVVSG